MISALCCAALVCVRHPDKTKHPVEEAKERYREITTAYEVLSDAEARAGYDEALLHPERLWANRLRYMQFKAAKQTDARFILSFTLLLASVLHWLYWGHRYEKVRELIALNPAVQTRMKNKVKADLIAEKIAAGDKKVSQRTPHLRPRSSCVLTDALSSGIEFLMLARSLPPVCCCDPPPSLQPAPTKDEIDARLSLEDVSSYAELTSWEGRRPTWIDALPVWLALAPFRFARGLLWHARYQLQYTLMGREYPEGSLDASYATAMALGMSYNKWLTVDEPKRAELVARKLWEPKLMEAWRRESVAAKKKTW